MNYYNEFDPKAAAWLRSLIAAGLIPDGRVDERSIVDVRASDLHGYTQCHFFAGIAGWPLALQLAGWPKDREVWTGSCPCQPFSSAGKQKGTADERHLWPEFKRLIGECCPATVFGEQVASKLGREWFTGVRIDLEGLEYAVGVADLCAAGVGAPHIRQRLYWVADAAESRCEHTKDAGTNRSNASEGCGVLQLKRSVAVGGLGDTERNGLRFGRRSTTDVINQSSHWSVFDTVACADGKTRRFEPGSFPLADGIPGRVVKLRGLGNAIVPVLAAEFVKACIECGGLT